MPERESLEFDVLFVGAGPASLAGALHLAKLIAKHNEAVARGYSPIAKTLSPSIAIIEKGRELGAHSISGAILDPRSLRELLAEDELEGAPLDTEVTGDQLLFLTENRKFKAPIVPPPLHNHGCYVVSLGRLVRWLGGLAEKKGIEIFTGFAGSELLYDGSRVAGVRTGDKGVDKKGQPKPNYEPGIDLYAKVTVLGEGARGSLAKGLISKFNLDRGKNPQIYSIGIKEVWEIPRGRLERGSVTHTIGYPLKSDTFGGAFIYALEETLVSLGLVVGLDYPDPLLDPHREFQRLKQHPFLRRLLEGGQMVRYGAKAIPEGGYFAMPRMYLDGALIVGDSAGFMNPMRLKGIHLAIKSGMLAAEAIFQALLVDDYSATRLSLYEELFEQSWARRELYRVRNFHQAFEHGMWLGLMRAGLQMLAGGRDIRNRLRNRPGHEYMRRIDEYYGRDARPAMPPLEYDGKLTFDKLTDVHYSGTRHEEDQPVHLLVRDTNICINRCTVEYGNPCQRFCPAAVYEMVELDGKLRLQINASNCVHCKTCDIMDPYGIIDWVPPEGGGGPSYEML